MNASLSFVLSTTSIFGFVLISHGAKPKNRVEFTKVECVTLLPEILQVNCGINRTIDNVTAIYVDFKLSQDVYSSNGIFSLFVKHGNKSIKYDTQNIDYCTVLANIHNQYLFQMIITEIRKISNIPLSCPFKKNKLYYVRGFVVDTKIIPSYFPKLSFNSEATINWNGKLAVCFKTFGQLRGKR